MTERDRSATGGTRARRLIGPTLLVLAVTVLLLAAVALSLAAVVAAVWLIRRTVPATREGFHAEVSAPMLGVVAALFGLLLAFVIIIAYENFLDANSNVRREADALSSIVRDSDAFPEPGGGNVRRAVRRDAVFDPPYAQAAHHIQDFRARGRCVCSHVSGLCPPEQTVRGSARSISRIDGV